MTDMDIFYMSFHELPHYYYIYSVVVDMDINTIFHMIFDEIRIEYWIIHIQNPYGMNIDFNYTISILYLYLYLYYIYLY